MYLDIEYDPFVDTLTIGNVEYDAELFRGLDPKGWPVGTWFKLMSRRGPNPSKVDLMTIRDAGHSNAMDRLAFDLTKDRVFLGVAPSAENLGRVHSDESYRKVLDRLGIWPANGGAPPESVLENFRSAISDFLNHT